MDAPKIQIAPADGAEEADLFYRQIISELWQDAREKFTNRQSAQLVA
jgi:hypothetical protein